MIESQKFVEIDGLHTCYYEAGVGRTVVLLHSGEHGGCADITWEPNFAFLAEHYHVIAPDWLGFGKTAKVHDFVSGAERRLRHMQRFFEIMGIEDAHLVGSSMGGTLLFKALSEQPGSFAARSLTAIGAGGDSPDSPARRALIDYDCTFEGMQRVVEALFSDARWPQDRAYVERRLKASLEPGAWECAAASRLKNPLVPARPAGGLVDTTVYEVLDLPVLLIAGAEDKIKEPGYAKKVAQRLKHGEVHEVLAAGHMPNIEKSDEVNSLLLSFFRKVDGIVHAA